MNNPELHRIIAVSRDLEAKGFKMNSIVVVSNAGDMNGLWVVRDRMHKRWTNRIDFLVDETLKGGKWNNCLLYTSPSPRDRQKSRMPSSA